MAKKEKSSFSFRPLLFLMLLLSFVFGGWWLWDNGTELKEQVFQYVENRDLLTLESKYSPEVLMETHRQELIGDENRSFLEPLYVYYPYLLLDVKYTENHKTREGVLLWGLEDGEIVLNTETWETTHGFKDCLECQANKNNFRIIQVLARHGGAISLDELQQELHLEKEPLEAWLTEAQSKHLIVQKGNRLQLHFENPKIAVIPQTRIKQQLVFKPLDKGEKVSRSYSNKQIYQIAKAAFGNDFAIRSSKEVFLPVYRLSVLNADGSIFSSEWNAVNGQRLFPSYLRY